jgi:CubicO group peptidase (beta-lactamase class C family)
MDIVAPARAGFSAERLPRINAVMQKFVERGQLAGTVTLLARHGVVAHLEACGMADIEKGLPMQADTIFRIYSMSKAITVVATLMLFEEGHFLLDDPIANFIPEFAATKVYAGEEVGTADGKPVLADLERPISIRDLLKHQSGLTYPNPDGSPVERIYVRERIGEDEKATLAEATARLAGMPLCHQPGASWTYGFSHDVLGRLVEVVAGRPFEAFLKERIFDPLGMVDTGFYVPAEKLGRLAAIYAPAASGGLLPVDDPWVQCAVPPRAPSGGGGLVATAMDYARFCQMLLNGGQLDGVRMLGRKTIDLLTADHAPAQRRRFPSGFPTDPGYSMALGVAVLTDVAEWGKPVSASTYTWGGLAGTRWWVDPQEDLVGVFMAQTLPGFWRAPDLFEVVAYQALE